jgi:hypothetical protein
MMLSKKEKENVVIDLLNKGHNVQYISKVAHVSFGFISDVRKKVTGENIENEKDIPLTTSSKVFKLFLDKKTLVEVAILLNLPPEEVLRIHYDYLTLQNNQSVATILKKHRNNLAPFWKWFDYIEKNNMKAKDLNMAIRYVNKLNVLGKKVEDLKNEKKRIIFDRDYLLDNLGDLQRKYS